MTRYFDLSQPIQPGMTIYPGDPVPNFGPAKGVEPPWRVADLHIGTHTGTHIDSVSHYFPAGKNVDEYPISRFILAGIVLPFPGLVEDQAITEEQISDGLQNLPEGGVLLIQTGWDRYWNTDTYFRHPYLSPEAVQRVIGSKASLVGIDALNVDSSVQGTTHVHHLLLEKEILIVENLANLSQLQPGKVYQFSFLPLRLAGLDGSPIRAVAW
jgi:arylformamidase